MANAILNFHFDFLTTSLSYSAGVYQFCLLSKLFRCGSKPRLLGMLAMTATYMIIELVVGNTTIITITITIIRWATLPTAWPSSLTASTC